MEVGPRISIRAYFIPGSTNAWDFHGKSDSRLANPLLWATFMLNFLAGLTHTFPENIPSVYHLRMRVRRSLVLQRSFWSRSGAVHNQTHAQVVYGGNVFRESMRETGQKIQHEGGP
jgi:hypothetical protein